MLIKSELRRVVITNNFSEVINIWNRASPVEREIVREIIDNYYLIDVARSLNISLEINEGTLAWLRHIGNNDLAQDFIDREYTKYRRGQRSIITNVNLAATYGGLTTLGWITTKANTRDYISGVVANTPELFREYRHKITKYNYKSAIILGYPEVIDEILPSNITNPNFITWTLSRFDQLETLKLIMSRYSGPRYVPVYWVNPHLNEESLNYLRDEGFEIIIYDRTIDDTAPHINKWIKNIQ